MIAYYLETASSSVTKIAGNGNDRERERNEWKKKAHEIISVLGNGNTNEGVVTGFFHGITSNALLAIQNSEATSETKSEAEAEGLDCEDLIHWYLQCITDCENNGHANVLNHAVRSYAKFASS